MLLQAAASVGLALALGLWQQWQVTLLTLTTVPLVMLSFGIQVGHAGWMAA